MDGGEELQIVESLSYWCNFDVVSDGIYYIPTAASVSWQELPSQVRVQFCSFANSRTQTVLTLDRPTVANGVSVSSDKRTLIASLVEDMGSDLMLVDNFR